MPKYLQTAIATTSLYDTQPGRSKPKLYGFYSEQRARTWTGRAEVMQSRQEEREVVRKPHQSFLLTKSCAPLKRDKVSRKLKGR